MIEVVVNTYSLTDKSDRRRVYHPYPDWHGEDAPGRFGEERLCNSHHWRNGVQIGSNGGAMLPEEARTPCGLTVYRRLDRGDETHGTYLTKNVGWMVNQGFTQFRLEVAQLIARPCKRCYK